MRVHPAPLPARLMAALLMTTQAACGGWQVTSASPRRYVTERTPDVVRVTLARGEQLTVRSPVIRGDSLVGIHVSGDSDARSVRVAVPLADIRQVESHRGPSPYLVLGGITLMLWVVATAVGDDADEAPYPSGTSGAEGFNFTSCPAIDSWDGRDWRLDSGTYSGAISAGLARSEVDNLEYASPEHGLLRLRVRTEPGETDHIDAVQVLAVTHAPDVRPLPDAKGHVYVVGALQPPVRAVDDRGRDMRRQLASRDSWAWESVPSGRDTSRMRDIRSWLELSFVRPPGARTARLVLDAVTTPWAAHLNRELLALNGAALERWFAIIDRHPTAAATFVASRVREAWLGAHVRVGDAWVPQGAYSEAGGEVSREQLVTLDLSAVDDDTVRVRLESAPSFWLVDYVGIDFGPAVPLTVDTLTLRSATAHDGRDVRPLLAQADRAELVQAPGDWAELAFAAPTPGDGVEVSYLVRATGWYRIHMAATGEPQTGLLTRLATEPWAISRLSTMRLNAALQALEASAR